MARQILKASELKRPLDDLLVRLRTAVEQAVKEEAKAIVADERQLVPVVTGELQGGIEARIDGLAAEAGIFDPELWWAIYIEWGRQGAVATQFATPSAEAARRRWPKRLEAAVRKVVDGV